MENVQARMEEIFEATCGSWGICNEASIRFFLYQCYEHSIDPQYCFNWLEEHNTNIPQWHNLSQIALDWVNEHTSIGSPIAMDTHE